MRMTSQVNSPCLGCPDRSVQCHGECEKYQSYVTECQRQRDERIVDSDAEYARREAYKYAMKYGCRKK